MAKEYDSITARHYAAYRPSLHSQILKSYLNVDDKFNYGLDIGCGTGQSAISLFDHCEKVVGVDTSKEMIEKSIIHTGVTYQIMQTNILDFDNDSFDIITFAGSLFYAKSQKLLDEVIRVSKPIATIILYDFEVLMKDTFTLLGINNTAVNNDVYDHQTNFSGLDLNSIAINKSYRESIIFDIKISDMAHLLLSAKDNYTSIATVLGKENVYEHLKWELRNKLGSDTTTLKANTYLTAYTAIK
ncbi:class I SAM-dependent methyltransferase [Maribacter ulvicola]|uniref:Methyltransferase domain-containing protein n=1 Tax=Maribacter ulvicola TaxID=228959 RepID=A0A1N6YSK5_9FLAO|nr:class I SAM-dependent methyltransferase [Maribacter ulvicola]SIR17603.1 Methyltransferase domain-containing protein [Maribacter ulvicola]